MHVVIKGFVKTISVFVCQDTLVILANVCNPYHYKNYQFKLVYLQIFNAEVIQNVMAMVNVTSIQEYVFAILATPEVFVA